MVTPETFKKIAQENAQRAALRAAHNKDMPVKGAGKPKEGVKPVEGSILTSWQHRACRGFMGLGVKDLAYAVGVSHAIITKLEKGEPVAGVSYALVIEAYRKAGIALHHIGDAFPIAPSVSKQPTAHEPEE